MEDQSYDSDVQEDIACSDSPRGKPVDAYAPTSNQDPVTILRECIPMIRRIAGSLVSRNPASLDIEDLTSAGVIGLLGALTRYDPARETKFWTFAEYRIRGMMLDEMRSMDWVPRSVRARHDQIRQASVEFVRREGRLPAREDIASLLGITQQELDASYVRETRLLSLDDPMGSQDEVFTLRDVLPDEEQLDPYDECLSSETNTALEMAMKNLSDRQQDVIQQYYFQGLTMKEIGQRLGLTESGVCRVHAEALRKLRTGLKEFDVPSTTGENTPQVKTKRSRKRQRLAEERQTDPQTP